MGKITAGGATVAVAIGNDGIAHSTFGGLVMPTNFHPLNSAHLRSGAERGAHGMVATVRKAAICCPADVLADYRTLPKPLHALPMAFIVSEAQMPLYAHLVRLAASQGIIRCAFLSESEAETWLREEVVLAQAQQAWLKAHPAYPEGSRKPLCV
jgi:hypothetical protein